jgi:hypothetical protein
MSEPIILHRWRYRDELTGKVVTTRYLATEAEARERFGDRLIEAVPSSREVRYPFTERDSTSGLAALNLIRVDAHHKQKAPPQRGSSPKCGSLSTSFFGDALHIQLSRGRQPLERTSRAQEPAQA